MTNRKPKANPEAPKFDPRDIKGEELRLGDYVQIVANPDFESWFREIREESEEVFRYLLGKRKRIDEIDEHGFVWFMFRIGRSHAGQTIHSTAHEPWLLQKVQPRKTKLV